MANGKGNLSKDCYRKVLEVLALVSVLATFGYSLYKILILTGLSQKFF